jgi:hypothetical protein
VRLFVACSRQPCVRDVHLLDRFKHGEMRLNRVEGFSDGVFGIVVTLLRCGRGAAAEAARDGR